MTETGYAFWQAGWHEGVIGIAASRICRRPSVARPFSPQEIGEYLRGASGACPANVWKPSQGAELLAGFGGHSGGQAVSVAIREALFRIQSGVGRPHKATALAIPLGWTPGWRWRGVRGTLRGFSGWSPSGREMMCRWCLSGLCHRGSFRHGQGQEHLRLKLSQDGVVKEFLWFQREKETPHSAFGAGGCGFHPITARLSGRCGSRPHQGHPAFVATIGQKLRRAGRNIAAASGQGEECWITWSSRRQSSGQPFEKRSQSVFASGQSGQSRFRLTLWAGGSWYHCRGNWAAGGTRRSQVLEVRLFWPFI